MSTGSAYNYIGVWGDRVEKKAKKIIPFLPRSDKLMSEPEFP